MKRLLLAACVGVNLGCPETTPVAGPEDVQAPMVDATDGPVMVWPDEEFRYAAPTPGPTPGVRIPAPTVFEMEGGITVYLVARDTLPTVSLSLQFPAGSVLDPPGKRGLVSLCMDLVEQGTEALDKPAFAARKADLASSVFAFGNRETSGVGMSSLHRNFEPTAALMLEMLDKPGLRQRDLDRLVARRKANLEQNKAAPGSLGRRLWRSVVWGPEHPHGVLTSDTQYDSITVEDCRTWLDSMGTRGATLFVAGSTDEGEIRRRLEAPLAAWGRDDKGVPRGRSNEEIAAAAPREGTVFFVDVPGAAQSQLYVGHPGPRRQSPDYEATMLMAQILGGGFASRINMNIREDKGYAYGARARFSYRRTGGTFAATSSVRSDATVPALREVLTEIRRIRSAPVQREELERERQGTLLGLPTRFSTAARVRGTYSSLVFYDLPLDWYDGFQKRVRAVDTGDVQKVAAKYLQSEGFKVLVVGDGDVVRDGLQKLASEEAFGDEGFVELDGDGNRVR